MSGKNAIHPNKCRTMNLSLEESPHKGPLQSMTWRSKPTEITNGQISRIPNRPRWLSTELDAPGLKPPFHQSFPA